MLYLSENLKKYRLLKNLTQEDGAELLHDGVGSDLSDALGVEQLLADGSEEHVRCARFAAGLEAGEVDPGDVVGELDAIHALDALVCGAADLLVLKQSLRLPLQQL